MTENGSSAAGVQPAEPEISVVVPFYNESGAAEALLDEIRTALDGPHPIRFEIVAVNDGSSDDTGGILRRWASTDDRLRPIDVEPNGGQAAALLLGMQAARAPILVTMDGDGQNDPADIPGLLERLPGADMVVGYRHPRNDSWLRKRMSRLANRVRGAMLHDGVRDSGCALKVMRREVADSFLPMKTLYSFMPALAVAGGFRVIEAPVHHRARKSGVSSYGFRQFLWRPFVDLLGVWWFVRRRIPAGRKSS
ncbi:MAG: glycosyltransferase family 2 protein [Thermoanaerobaculia bacterium]